MPKHSRLSVTLAVLVVLIAVSSSAGVISLRHTAYVEGVTPGVPVLGVDDDGPWCSLELLNARQSIYIVARQNPYYQNCAAVDRPMLVKAVVKLRPHSGMSGAAPVHELTVVKMSITID